MGGDEPVLFSSGVEETRLWAEILEKCDGNSALRPNGWCLTWQPAKLLCFLCSKLQPYSKQRAIWGVALLNWHNYTGRSVAKNGVWSRGWGSCVSTELMRKTDTFCINSTCPCMKITNAGRVATRRYSLLSVGLRTCLAIQRGRLLASAAQEYILASGGIQQRA